MKCPEVFYKKDVPKNFSEFAEKHLCQSLFLNKVAGQKPLSHLASMSQISTVYARDSQFLPSADH